jgi:hypothetical protein
VACDSRSGSRPHATSENSRTYKGRKRTSFEVCHGPGHASALKLATVSSPLQGREAAGQSSIRSLRWRFRQALFVCRLRLPCGEPAASDGASSQLGKRATLALNFHASNQRFEAEARWRAHMGERAVSGPKGRELHERRAHVYRAVIALRTQRVRGCNAARRKRRPRGGPDWIGVSRANRCGP